MSAKRVHKPELLLPVGNPEAFYAALQGGANAIYFGLQQFNARSRAKNFTPWQAAAMVNEARKKGVKSYITLNTVVRNTELMQLADTLHMIVQIKPDAVIVQDWGVVYLIRKFFPQLTVHASTQMGIHNSAGVEYANNSGIKRVVLAREITQTELQKMAQHTKTELEVFVHGALCYSFSGMCLFSSYLGGASANRGQCAQPCRRNYVQNNKESYFFSLKDNQLIEHIASLENFGISSIKVEGRLKSADYVFQVAKAYRTAIDHPSKRAEAQQQLMLDLGREKTAYFFGKDVHDAITQSAGTGLKLGTVTNVENRKIYFTSNYPLQEGYRIRFRNLAEDDQNDYRANALVNHHPEYNMQCDANDIKPGMEVYLSRTNTKFPTKIETEGIKINNRISQNRITLIKSNLQHKKIPGRNELWIRIDCLEWLPFLSKMEYKGIILQLGHKELVQFEKNTQQYKAILPLIHIEFPKFIAEDDIDFHREMVAKLHKTGIHSFFLSQLSQKILLPQGATFSTNENVYAFNDAAIKWIKDEKALHLVYPLENDIVNMGKGSHREGIVPVYFRPQLFYSRMPVKLEKEELFVDKAGEEYRKMVRDGITIVIPKNPVSILQFKGKMERFGFFRFLIDVSFEQPSKERIASILSAYNKAEALKPSSIFNFKRELK